MSGELEYHPYADVFPLTEGKEFDDLVNDIKKQGLISPIVLYQGKILDGRNRYRAMLQLGFPEKRILKHCTERGDIENPLNFVIGANIRRRHLTAEDKRKALELLIKANPEQSDRQIAAAAHMSPTTVGAARSEMEEKGEVSKLDTRVDAKGVKQPAKKKASHTPLAKAKDALEANPGVDAKQLKKISGAPIAECKRGYQGGRARGRVGETRGRDQAARRRAA
jgi:hypothetical protein